MRRIDRNHYEPEKVLEIVREQTDADAETALLGRDELLRLLEESAQAYYLLRADCRELVNAITEASCLIDKDMDRRMGWKR